MSLIKFEPYKPRPIRFLEVYHQSDWRIKMYSISALFSDNGISTCVWELEVWWHERNAWIKHVMKQNDNPDFEAYLGDQFNAEI